MKVDIELFKKELERHGIKYEVKGNKIIVPKQDLDMAKYILSYCIDL